MIEGKQYLPPGWALDKLKHVIEPRGEKVSPADYPEYYFLGMDHVEAHSTRIIGSIPAAQMKSNAARFYAGDVLYGRLRPYLNKVTKPTFDGLASAEFIVFPNTDLILSAYLKYRLNAADFVSFASHLNEGDRPRVSFDQIGEFGVLVPPPAEQHRIVAKIEQLFSELDKGVESLKTAREQLKVYRQAVLKHAFEGKLTAQWREENADKLETPEKLLARIRKEREARHEQQLTDWRAAVKTWEAKGKEGKKPRKPSKPEINSLGVEATEFFPRNWAALELSHLAGEAVLGKMLDKTKNLGKPRHYLGNINVRWGSFDLDSLKTMRIEDSEVERYRVVQGDLIVCEGGEPGRCAVWKASREDIFIQKALHRLRFTRSYNSYFAYYFLVYASLTQQIAKYFTGTTIKHLTGTGLVPLI